MNNCMLQSCFLSLIICFLLFKLLSNKTIEVEKFSNQPIVYSTNGHELSKENVERTGLIIE